MRAWRYQDRIDIDDLQEVSLPNPTPKENEVVVRIRAAGLNNRDLAIAAGNYHVGVAAPLTPLSDGAGEIIAIGSAVRRFRVGEKVCPLYLPDWHAGEVRAGAVGRRLGGPTNGTMTELFCSDADDFVNIPQHLSFEEAAALPVAWLTAYHTLTTIGKLQPGQKLVVQGTGGVSTAAIQLGNALGLRVISVTRKEERVALMLQCGAAAAVVDRGDDSWPKKVMGVAEGGVDAVLTVAGGDHFGVALNALRLGGRILMVGYAGGTSAKFDVFDAIRHAATIHTATAGHTESFKAMNVLIDSQKIRPLIGHVFPVDEYKAAFSALACEASPGKLILRI
jgi:NADPH:quinone reductase-like Zn-dependent oxidoreductase